MSALFKPIRIGAMWVKNRFVRSATQDYLGNPDGTISDAEIELYRQLAAGDTGLIITAHSYVEQTLGRASIRQNAIYDDKFIPGYRRLADTVHAYGAALVLQISHAGRQTPPDWPDGLSPMAPSAVTDGSTGVTPREITEEEIWRLIDSFAAAISRAKTAGCDGVQLHIAHGYALSQFISPYTNRRTDQWGDSLENRTRILREIIARSRSLVGPDFPILVKLNSTDGLDSDRCLTMDEVVQTAKSLEGWGIDAIEVSGGIREAKGIMSRPGIVKIEQEAYFAAACQTIKQAVNIPVILVGGLRSLAVMERIVADGVADMTAICRPLIKEPDLVASFAGGQAKASCVSCNACFNPSGLKCYLPEK